MATDLFEKGEWDLCRRECLRDRIDGEDTARRFQLLEALALDRSGAEPSAAVKLLEPIAAGNTEPDVKAMAAYELGRLQWRIDRPEAAIESFRVAFTTTTDKELFLHAACAMFQLMDEHKNLRQGREDLVDQINTSRSQWSGALFAETAKPNPAKDRPKAPNWVIRFYRSQISPAIGRRCILEPSCSEYFTQAEHAHGLLGFPMIADRLCREPDVSNAKKDPVVMPDGQIRYRDPIAAHDFWMKKP